MGKAMCSSSHCCEWLVRMGGRGVPMVDSPECVEMHSKLPQMEGKWVRHAVG